MKTIREWFQELPTDVRIKAETNARPSAMSVKAPTLASAIGGSFVWAESPEGQVYWEQITNQYAQ